MVSIKTEAQAKASLTVQELETYKRRQAFSACMGLRDAWPQFSVCCR